MPAPVDLSSLLSPSTFSLFIAPPEIIQEALITLMSRHRGKILYLCGNYPVILPKITLNHDRLQIRRALTIYQVQSILEESTESLILFEHDRSLYDDNADLLPYIGRLCAYKAGDTGMVFLFSTRLDKWLTRIESFVERVVLITKKSPRVRPVQAVSVSTQTVLDGMG